MDELAIIELFWGGTISVKASKLCALKSAFNTPDRKSGKEPFETSFSEVLTILALSQRSNYRTFKHFYLYYVKQTFAPLFAQLVGYSRFVQLTQKAFFPMFCFANEHRGRCEGILFLDSTAVTICHVRRASSHRTFKEKANWGKTPVGWFFGFKLQLVISYPR